MNHPERRPVQSTFPTLRGYVSYVEGVRFLRWQTPSLVKPSSYASSTAHGTERLSSSGGATPLEGAPHPTSSMKREDLFAG